MDELPKTPTRNNSQTIANVKINDDSIGIKKRRIHNEPLVFQSGICQVNITTAVSNPNFKHQSNNISVNDNGSNLTSLYKQNITELNELQDTLFRKKTQLDTLKDELLEYKDRYKEFQNKWESSRQERTTKQQEFTLKSNELSKMKEEFKIKENHMNQEQALKLQQLRAINNSDINKLSNQYMSEIDKLRFEKVKKYEEERTLLVDDVTKIQNDITSNPNVLDDKLKDSKEKQNIIRTVWQKTFDDELKNLTGKKYSYISEVSNLTETVINSLKPRLEEEVRKLGKLKDRLTVLEKNAINELKDIQEVEKETSLKRIEIQDTQLKKIELQEYIVDTENELSEISEILIKEETMRRELHNELQELRGNIRVFCRVRPPLKGIEDFATDHIDVQSFDDNNGIQSIEIQKDSGESQKFSFDRIFDQTETNFDVFDEIGQLVQSSLDGYNVCIFAYGQTGSGKTFTMLNPRDGMIPATITHIFNWVENLKEKGWEYHISCQFVEIYNENIIDLLRDEIKQDTEDVTYSGKHEIRHDQDTKTTTITNINTSTLKSKDSVDDLLKRAAKLRSTASTAVNERSSRSHSIFTIHLRGTNKLVGEKSYGILNLVDLAGSERLNSSQVVGTRLRETQNINKSLSCLGDVIHALGSVDAAKRHIPFRNSKLTYLLQYSLTGNSKTLMFVNISPTQNHINETLNSLRFASKVNSTKMVTKSN